MLDEGSIAAFDQDQVPLKELVLGALIPRDHAIAYLKRCDIQYGIDAAIPVADEPVAEDSKSSGQQPEGDGQEIPTSPSLMARMHVAFEPTIHAPVIPRGPILRMKDLTERTGLSRATLYTLMDPKSPYCDPKFPAEDPAFFTVRRLSGSRMSMHGFSRVRRQQNDCPTD